jgi:hypothetical protein
VGDQTVKEKNFKILNHWIWLTQILDRALVVAECPLLNVPLATFAHVPEENLENIIFAVQSKFADIFKIPYFNHSRIG